MTRGARQHESAGTAVPVEFGLDRIQHDRGLLVLVDADGRDAGYERRRVRCERVSGRRVVQVEQHRSATLSDVAQQGGLSDRARSFQQHDRVVDEPLQS